MSMIETRLAEGRVVAATMEIRDVETSTGRINRLSGRAVPYNEVARLGWYDELIDPGAFTKSIREAANGLPLMLFHNAESLDSIIGKAESWDERDDGLHGVWKLTDADAAQRAARMARDGVLGYLSIGFQPIRSSSTFDDDDNLTITRHEARLLETSLVPTPAYQSATVTKVRCADPLRSEDIGGRRVRGWREYLDKITASAS